MRIPEAPFIFLAIILSIAINFSINAILKIKTNIYVDVVIPIIGIPLVYMTFNLFKRAYENYRKENQK